MPNANTEILKTLDSDKVGGLITWLPMCKEWYRLAESGNVSPEVAKDLVDTLHAIADRMHREGKTTKAVRGHLPKEVDNTPEWNAFRERNLPKMREGRSI